MKKAIAILLIIVAAGIVAYRQPKMVEVDRVDGTGMYLNYIDSKGDAHRGVPFKDAPAEVQAIAENF